MTGDTFCAYHERLLVDAVELRGLDREGQGHAALDDARERIVKHATHFAGSAAIVMLTSRSCALCFINQNPAHVNCDDWVNEAANEVLAAAPPLSRLSVVFSVS